MRMIPSGRGLPPEVGADVVITDGFYTCLHLWAHDEASGDAKDLFAANGIVDLTDVNTVVSSSESVVGPRGRYFIAALSTYFHADMPGGDADSGSVTSGYDVAVVTLADLETVPVSNFTIFDYVGDTAAGSTFRVSITPARLVKVEWYDSGPTLRSAISTFAVPIDRGVPIIVRRRYINGYSEVKHDLFLYGEFVEEMTGDNDLPFINGTGEPAEILIGAASGATKFFNGRIDFVGFYFGELTDDWCEKQMRRMRRIGCPDVTHAKIEVSDGSTLRDMTNLAGHNWVQSWVVREGVDQQTPTATVNFLREVGEMSLSKYHDNRMNRVPVDAIGPDTQAPHDDATELLDLSRPILIKTATLPYGLTPVTRDYALIFDGLQSKIGWGGNDPTVRVECFGRSSVLQKRRISEVRTYPEQALETTMQSIIDDNLGGGVFTLYVPTPTGATLREWTQERTDIWSALTKLAEIPALSLGWVFDEANNVYRLTLYEPDRTYSVTKAMATLTTDDYAELSKMEIDLANIRDDMTVSYDSYEPSPPTGFTYAGGGGGLGSDGKPTRGYVRIDSDDIGSNAITRFGRQEMEKAEKGADGITTYQEAERQCLGMLRDLQDPVADVGVTGWFMHAALGTALKFYAPRPQSTADQRLAVTGFEHNGTKDSVRTTLELRGHPCGAITRHLESEARPGQADPPPRSGYDIIGNLTLRERLAPHAFDMLAITPRHSGPPIGPPNHDFNQHRISRQAPPDGWTQTGGTWGTDAVVNKTASNVLTGQQSLQLRTSSAVLKSSRLAVQEGASGGGSGTQKVGIVVKASSSTTVTVEVDWLDIDNVAISTSTLISAVSVGTTWKTLSGTAAAPANSRFMRIVLKRGAGSTEVYVDRVLCKASEGLGLSFRAKQTGGEESLTDSALTTFVFQSDSAGHSATGSWDDGGLYNTSTGEFTVLQSGYWDIYALITIGLIYNGDLTEVYAGIYLNGSLLVRSPTMAQIDPPNDDLPIYLNAGRIWLDADDVLVVKYYAVDSVGSPPDWGPYVGKSGTSTYFSATFIG